LPARQVLTPAQVRRRCPSESLGFATTADVATTDRLIGQARAADALEFGLGVEVGGSVLGRFARERPTPPDWCYVHYFARPDEPEIISLPPDAGPRLKREVDGLA